MLDENLYKRREEEKTKVTKKRGKDIKVERREGREIREMRGGKK